MLCFPSVLSAASCRSLRERLQSLGESDRQMCHQVNQSDFGSSHSWAYRPSLTVCALVLQPPLLSPLTLALLYPLHPSLSCRCSLLSVSSFLRLSPTPFLWSPCPHFPHVCIPLLALILICFVLMRLALFLSLKELRVGSFPTWSAPAPAGAAAAAAAQTDWTQMAWKNASWVCSTQTSHYVIKYSTQMNDKKHQRAIIIPRNT